MYVEPLVFLLLYWFVGGYFNFTVCIYILKQMYRITQWKRLKNKDMATMAATWRPSPSPVTRHPVNQWQKLYQGKRPCRLWNTLCDWLLIGKAAGNPRPVSSPGTEEQGLAKIRFWEIWLWLDSCAGLQICGCCSCWCSTVTFLTARGTESFRFELLQRVHPRFSLLLLCLGSSFRPLLETSQLSVMELLGLLCAVLLCTAAVQAKPMLRKDRVLHPESELSKRTPEDNNSFQYDHEAFLGKEEAKTFDQLTQEESKERLG